MEIKTLPKPFFLFKLTDLSLIWLCFGLHPRLLNTWGLNYLEWIIHVWHLVCRQEDCCCQQFKPMYQIWLGFFLFVRINVTHLSELESVLPATRVVHSSSLERIQSMCSTGQIWPPFPPWQGESSAPIRMEQCPFIAGRDKQILLFCFMEWITLPPKMTQYRTY